MVSWSRNQSSAIAHGHSHLPHLDLAGRPFVANGITSALEQAQSAAGDGDVSIAGGASTVRQYLAAGSLDELYLHIVPVILGSGERLLEDVGDPVLEPIKVVASPAATHIKYRIVKRA
jgi:dihydrofolate reductase